MAVRPVRHGDMAGSGATRQATKLTLAAVPAAVGRSRAFVRHVLYQWRLAHLTETAELLTSELVTNAVEATGTSDVSPRCAVVGDVHLIEVRVVLAECLFVGVWDRDARLPVPQEPDLGAESGRGLFLVDFLSKRWGYYHPPVTGGKVVWYEIEDSW